MQWPWGAATCSPRRQCVCWYRNGANTCRYPRTPVPQALLAREDLAGKPILVLGNKIDITAAADDRMTEAQLRVHRGLPPAAAAAAATAGEGARQSVRGC